MVALLLNANTQKATFGSQHLMPNWRVETRFSGPSDIVYFEFQPYSKMFVRLLLEYISEVKVS
jgi:hypothetical protein